MTYVEVTQELADLLAAKIVYKRQFNASLSMEQAVMESFTDVLAEREDLSVEVAAHKQSSPELSSLAASYMSIDLPRITEKAKEDPMKLIADIRSIAASVVSQDETPKDAT